MKKLLFILVLSVGLFAQAAKKGSPFAPHVDDRLDQIETLSSAGGIDLAEGSVILGDSSGDAKSAAHGSDGQNLKHIVRANLDCGVSDCSVGTVSMGQTLPAKAIITQSYFYTETQFVDGGSGTVALHCEDANNIYSAADITGISAGAITSGVSTGTAANMQAAIAAECTITATIATAEQTAGVLTLYVEYVVHD